MVNVTSHRLPDVVLVSEGLVPLLRCSPRAASPWLSPVSVVSMLYETDHPLGTMLPAATAPGGGPIPYGGGGGWTVKTVGSYRMATSADDRPELPVGKRLLTLIGTVMVLPAVPLWPVGMLNVVTGGTLVTLMELFGEYDRVG